MFVKLLSNFALLGLGDVARTRPDLYDLQYHLWLWVGDKKKAAYKDGVLDVLERRISSIGVDTYWGIGIALECTGIDEHAPAYVFNAYSIS